MLLGHLVAGDGDEARQTRFGGEQVIVRGIQPARPFGIGQPKTDREHSPCTLVEKRPVHAVGEGVGALREIHQALPDRIWRSRRDRQGNQRLVERTVPPGEVAGRGARRRLPCDAGK